MAFTVQNPDFETSPMTGMTREHWIEAGKFFLDGVFQHVTNPDDPIIVPPSSDRIYPKPDDPAFKHRAAEFEGLSRTFMIGAGLVANRPEIEAGGHALRDYYAGQVLNITDPSHPRYVGVYPELKEEYNSPLFQHTAESAALAVGLWVSREQIWDRYSDAERDQVARVLASFANGRTNAHNWRWFTAMLASFLKATGYGELVNDTALQDHLWNLSAYYAGDGWYRDNGQFDYYSCWAFQFYGPLWCSIFGYENMPDLAGLIEERHNELQKTYPRMFGRNGFSLMWGRSIIYRCAAAAPLAVAGLLKNPAVDPGWARRICSGNLLQFVTRDDLFVDGIPSLGFYRQFEPLLQSYSCSISPFWLAKVFLGLHVPADAPYWTATENEGEWEQLGEDDQQTTVLDGPGLAITMQKTPGTAEIRPGKINASKSDPNYTRLAYNTAFPWEADSPTGASAMDYSIKELGTDYPFATGRGMLYGGWRDGVLYRSKTMPGWMSRIELADIPVPGGVLRVDRLSLALAHELNLGHYALPHLGGKAADVSKGEKNGRLVIHGKIDMRQVILVAYRGWDGVDAAVHEGLNAEADESTVIYAWRKRDQHYSGIDLAVTLMLHHTEPDNWILGQRDPVEEMEYLPVAPSGHPAGLRLKMKDGRELVVDWGNVMGELKC